MPEAGAYGDGLDQGGVAEHDGGAEQGNRQGARIRRRPDEVRLPANVGDEVERGVDDDRPDGDDEDRDLVDEAEPAGVVGVEAVGADGCVLGQPARHHEQGEAAEERGACGLFAQA